MTEILSLQVARRGLNIYRVATPGWRAGWNRLGSHTLGWAVVLWRWCFSFVWNPASRQRAKGPDK